MTQIKANSQLKSYSKKVIS